MSEPTNLAAKTLYAYKPRNVVGNPISGYKNFSHDFAGLDQDLQYEVGKTFENLSDVYFYGMNPLAIGYRFRLLDRDGLPCKFAEVTGFVRDEIEPQEYDRLCASKLIIDKEITLEELIRAHIEKSYQSIIDKDREFLDSVFVSSSIKDDAWIYANNYNYTINASGNKTRIVSYCDNDLDSDSKNPLKASLIGFYSSIASIGDNVKLLSNGMANSLFVIGDYGTLTSNGLGSGIFAKGCGSDISSTGTSVEIISLGNEAKISSTGNEAKIFIVGDAVCMTSTGDYTTVTVTGNKACVTNTGYDSRICYKGERGVISLLGFGATFNASEGTIVSAIDYDNNISPIDLIKGRIGEDGLKPDTQYVVEKGKFVEREVFNQ